MTPLSAYRPGPKSVTADDAAVGQRILSMRKERGMSQADIAKTIGVSYQQFQKYENGSNRISGARILKIAAAFDCPPAALLGNSETRAEQSLGDKMTATRRGCRTAAAFVELEGDAQDLLMNVAEWLLQVQNRPAVTASADAIEHSKDFGR